MIFLQGVGSIVYIILIANFCSLTGHVGTLLITYNGAIRSLYIVIVQVGFIKRITRHLIYADIRIGIELIAAATFFYLVDTRNDTFLVLFGQLHNLIIDESSVHSEVDCPLTGAVEVYVGVDFKATVADNSEVLCNHRLCGRRTGCAG